MRAILLCAGFGTRLHPLTVDRPKPLLPVAGRPIVSHLVAQLASTSHVGEMTLVSNHRFYDAFERFRNELAQTYPDVDFEVLDDGAVANGDRLGAVRDLAFALSNNPVLRPTLVAAGDNLFDASLDDFLLDYLSQPRNLVARHREMDRERLRRTGVVEIDSDGRILRFWEKPEEPETEWACPALYLLEPSALGRLDRFLNQATDPDNLGAFIGWLSGKEPVYTHEIRGRRIDVGDPKSYEEAKRFFVG